MDPDQPVKDSEPGRLHHEHVCKQVLLLFDLTQPVHGMGDDRRFLLSHAANLHDIPLPDKKKKALLAARERVAAECGEQLSAEEQELLAGLVTFHQGRMKAGDFSAEQRQETLTLAAILGIANGLDAAGSQQTHIQRVEGVTGQRTPPGEIWVLAAGPQALRDVQAAGQTAGLWARAGFPMVQIVEAEIAEGRLFQGPYPEGMPKTSGILPDDPMAEAGRKVWRYQFAALLKNEEGTRLGEDIEALHDMRVATRRMRAGFEIFGPAFEPEAIKPHLRGLRGAGRALGRVRDLDVFMEKAQHYLDGLPEADRNGLDPLLAGWQAERETARAEMLAHLDSRAYHAFKWHFNTFVTTPGLGALPASLDHPTPQRVREVAPILIYTRLAAVRAYDQVLHNAAIEQLHALRIEFKKLRYAVEFFREVLGPEASAVINDLKKMQDHLGDLNDADVAAHILGEFLEGWEPRQTGLPVGERHSGEAIVTYLAYQHAERHRLMAGFPEAWAYFNRPEFRQNLALAVAAL